MIPIKLTFLGTGGGRFTTILQKRRTGGFRIDTAQNHIHVDPGPGALIYSNKFDLNPTKLTSIILTHSHPDHYNDVEVLIEAMTKGGTRNRGTLLSNKSGLTEVQEYGPAVSSYHKNLPNRTHLLNEKNKFSLKNNVTIHPKEVKHSDPTTIGFVIETKFGKIGYTSDTEYFKELPKKFSDLRVLIANNTRPRGEKIPHHLSTNDTIKLLNQINPKTTFITHFGMKMLETDPQKEAEIIKKETGQNCVAAQDGMSISINENIEIEKKQKKITNW